MGAENDKFAASNVQLEKNVNKLEGEVNKMTKVRLLAAPASGIDLVSFGL